MSYPTYMAGLASARRAAGLTQEQLADRLGSKRVTVTNWENGRMWPSARWLPQLAELLHCTIEDLYTDPDVFIIQKKEASAPCRGTAAISTATPGGLPG